MPKSDDVPLSILIPQNNDQIYLNSAKNFFPEAFEFLNGVIHFLNNASEFFHNAINLFNGA